MHQEFWLSTIWSGVGTSIFLLVILGFFAWRNHCLKQQKTSMEKKIEALTSTEKQLASEIILVDLARALAEATTIEMAIPIVLEAALDVAGANSGAVYLFNGHQKQAQVAAELGISDTIEKRLSSHLVVASLSHDAFLAPPFYGSYKDFLVKIGSPIHDKLNAKSFASIPIFNERNIALLLHIHYRDPHIFDDNFKFVIERFRKSVSAELSRICAFESISQTLAIAESQNNSTESILQNIGFEIRTSLNSIVGATEVLKTLGLDSNQLSMVSYVEQSTQELHTTLSQMLEFASTKDSSLSISHDNTDLRALLTQVMSVFHPWAQAKNMSISFSMSSSIPYLVQIDASRLRQVIVNLVGIAIRYTIQNQLRLDIKTEIAASNKIVLRFCISDTGIGLSKSKLQSLFSMVEKSGDKSQALSNHGGLALAVTKKMIEFMGGEIGVEPADTLGSMFWFTIPVENTLSESNNCDNRESHKNTIESFRKTEQEQIPQDDIWAQKDFLRRVSGDLEIVKHLKSIFDSTVPEKLVKLSQATTRNNRLACDSLSHEIKGVAQNMHMPRLLEAIMMYREQLIEKEQSPDVLMLYYDLIHEEFERTRAMRP